MKIVAVTSCITGIAHTYMAAEALEQAAKKAGYEITVETQGSAGSSPMKQATIDSADVVIFATDLEVKDRGRFAGKPFLQIGVSKALADAENVVAQAVSSIATLPKDGAAAPAAPKAAPAAEKAPKNDSGEKPGFFSRLFGSK
ncbi:PTS system fructose-specific IIB component [Aurantimicrobium minutum]|uniref:PTS fructose transporter subunit IIB n=1 Tax=Aurantimicrobium minutum TaxID=708131 RepID=UPI002473D751|nr:PTS fructose transporter subunit IIB [Aurantimicrobium minutum]MDH6531853.1 PTS system fructose-specific IIB component [Aurantimicrobium minutum]